VEEGRRAQGLCRGALRGADRLVDPRAVADWRSGVHVGGRCEYSVAPTHETLLPHNRLVCPVQVDRTFGAREQQRPDVGVQARDLGGARAALLVEEACERAALVAGSFGSFRGNEKMLSVVAPMPPWQPTHATVSSYDCGRKAPSADSMKP
jgi:hypothetical protein